MARHEYLATKQGFRVSGKSIPAGMSLGTPVAADAEQLASLMLDAYRDTIDYEGENLNDARAEIKRYLDGEAYLSVSRVIKSNGSIQAGALLGRIAGAPMVGYVMTRAAVKNRGLATVLLDVVADAVWAAGYQDLRAFITAGNIPSEKIFTNAGFEVIATYDD